MASAQAFADADGLWGIARDVAPQMISGGLLPEDGARRLWGLWWSCDNAKEIGLILGPLDMWEKTVPARRDVEATRAEIRAVAEGVVRAANAHLAGKGLSRDG